MRRFCTMLPAVAFAAVVGPGCGSSPVTPTPPPAQCTFQVTSSGQSFGAAGGSSTITITTATGCTWSASANEMWVTLGASGGTGSGTLSVTVAPNGSTATRQCAVTVAGQTLAMTQDGAAQTCALVLTPERERFDAAGDSRTFRVTAPSTCAWSAVSQVPWIKVTGAASGTGDGTVSYLVEEWNGQTERSGVIRIGDRDFTVQQNPPVPDACTYSVSPVVFTPCMRASTLSATLTTDQGCPWTVAAAASWITLADGGSRSGPATVTFQISENYDAPRQGILEVRWPAPTAGQNLQVQQAGCGYAVSRDTVSVAAGGESLAVDVYQQSFPNECGGPLQNGCIWTAVADVSWITITTSMPQAGDNPVRFTVAPNGTGTARSGSIAIRDKTIRVTQAGS